ncbi:alpha-amylase [Parabacteroides sp. OttesenSCG-928-N08]|nr:alpha-amylase [Parabacteroides sp. OttesenSCG-928-N08]
MKQQLFTILLASCFTLSCLVACGDSKDEPDPPAPPQVEEVENNYVIYEVNPGLFGDNGAFNNIANRLDEIQAMGVNVLWLMPVYEQGVRNAIGSPYCVKDYKQTNAAYGTVDDLKSLVNKAHIKGMKVILDWVANHTSWDHAWIANKAWYTQDAAGNIISPQGMGWSDVADLNYANDEMRQAMLDAMTYWVTEADIDGYRCDHAEGVPGDFWKEAINALKALKGDDLLMLAESGNSSFFADGFDLVYSWDFAYKLQDLFNGKSTLSSLHNLHLQEYEGVPKGKNRMRYITNHDMAFEKSPIQVYGSEEAALAAFVIAATWGGTPMIYSSQEVGYDQPLSFFNRQSLDWNSNAAYTMKYQKLMEVYVASDALRKGELTTYNTDKVATFSRKSLQQRLLVMVNTSGAAQQVKVPIEFALEEVRSLIDKSTMTLPVAITLDPYQYHIWTID